MCVDNGQHNHIIDSSTYFLMLKNDVNFFFKYLPEICDFS